MDQWPLCLVFQGKSYGPMVAGAESSSRVFPLESRLGAEIWEGDERRKFQLIEFGDSLNGGNLFTELSFL